jgi:hypothetical protein
VKIGKSELSLIASSIVLNSPQIFRPYLWADAVSYFGERLNGESPEITEIVSGLRPIYAWFVLQTSVLLDEGFPLHLFYVFSWLCNLACALYFFTIMKDYKFPFSISLLTSHAVIFLPPFQNYTHDLVMWPMNGLLLAILITFGKREIFGIKNRLKTLITLIFAMAIYQPLAAFAALLIGIRFLSNVYQNKITREQLKSELRFSFKELFLLGTQLFFAYLLVKLLVRIDVSNLTNRAEFMSGPQDLISKLKWVATVWIPTFLRPTLVSTTNLSVFISITLSFILISLGFFKMRQDSILRILIVLIFPFFTIAACGSHLVLRQNQFEFRSFPALCLGGFLWLSVLMQKLVSESSNNGKRDIASSHLAMWLLGLIFSAFISSWNLWINPTYARDRIIEEVMRDKPKMVCQVIPNRLYEPNKRLGIYSLKSDIILGWVNENIWTAPQVQNTKIPKEIIVTTSRKLCPDEYTIADFSGLVNLNELIPSL